MSGFNPFTRGNADEIAQLIVDLMPTCEPMMAEQMASSFEQHEARYGDLPPGTYRMLCQGGIVGWRYELEIDGEAVTLCEPGKPDTCYAVQANGSRATELARAEIARRHGPAAADNAKFQVVWGGCL